MASSTTTTAHLGTTEKVSVLRVITYAGAIIAFLIGSGFATGQEILQYYASYGFWGIFGTGSIVLVLISYVSVEFFLTGRREQFEKPSGVFYYYCGKHLGVFFDYFSILFVFLSFTVMIAGAGAVFQEYHGLSKFVGGTLLAVAVAATVWFGLTSLVDVIGKIGPVIVVVAIALGIYGIVRNPDGIAAGNALLEQVDVMQASSNWLFSGLSYVGFCMLWLAAFLAALGKTVKNRREATAGGLVGGIAFSLACAIVGLGLLANMGDVFDAEIPMLVLASDLGPWVGALISVMILAGIFTTAIPLLWTVTARFFDEKTKQSKYLTIALAALGTVIGLVLPFSQMVNTVYVINGYVGIVLLVLMIVRTVRHLATRSRRAVPAEV
jgi:uncharacterized membrane protein YkvI